MTADESKIIIPGREIRLESGAMVWGGVHKDSICWKFTSVEGGITHLTLSRNAVTAMVHIFQGLIGCDPGFVSVELEGSSSPTRDEHAG